ncbi:MAG: DoxX family protein [Arcobacter sp.]|nr:MAG: DoxX family protein [Arcobacter sp.]
MRTKLFLGTQAVVGLVLVVFGLNGFLQFLPLPPANDELAAFGMAVYKTGYIFPLMAILELFAGVSFLLNRFSALSAVLIMPVMINALFAHIFLDMNGIAPSLFIVLGILFVMFKNKEAYALMFKA